jgi:hypothetical protein
MLQCAARRKRHAAEFHRGQGVEAMAQFAAQAERLCLLVK